MLFCSNIFILLQCVLLMSVTADIRFQSDTERLDRGERVQQSDRKIPILAVEYTIQLNTFQGHAKICLTACNVGCMFNSLCWLKGPVHFISCPF
jgi:hypothetical protein